MLKYKNGYLYIGIFAVFFLLFFFFLVSSMSTLFYKAGEKTHKNFFSKTLGKKTGRKYISTLFTRGKTL